MSTSSPPPATDLSVGQRVTVMSRVGTIKFVGETKFQPGLWVGVALDEKVGKNNGKVQNVQYFECADNHGIFVKPDHVTVMDGDAPAALRKSGAVRQSTVPSSKASPAEKSGVAFDKAASLNSVEGGDEAKPAASKAMQTLELLRKNVPELRKRITQQQQLIEKEKQSLQASESNAGEPDAAKLASELHDCKAATEKIRHQVQTWESQATKLEQEIQHLTEKKNSSKADSSAPEDLSSFHRALRKAELELEIEEQRYQELQLDLEEFELSQEEEQALFSPSAGPNKNMSKFAANSKMVCEYEAALQLLNATSSHDLGNLRERAEELERESQNVIGLNTNQKELYQKKQDLQDSIITMESEYAEQRTLSQTSDQLTETQSDVTTEYMKQLEFLDARVKKYEVLVDRMHKEKLEVEAGVTADENRAKDLAVQIQQLTDTSADSLSDTAAVSGDRENNGPLQRHSRAVSIAVRQQLASLAASAATCRAEAFVACIPETWKPGSEDTGAVDRDALGKVAESASMISLVESCLCRTEALTSHLCTSSLASLPHGSDQMAKWLCALCLICGSSAAAAATALCKLRAAPPDSEQMLKAGPVEVIITEKEGNLGLIVKGVPPAKTLPVEKVAEGSLAEKHEIKPKSTLIAVQGKTTEKMNLETFKAVMKQRPLHLLLRPPQQANGKSNAFNLSLDMETCMKAQDCLDKLLKSCRAGAPNPDPEILQIVGTLESQFTALQHCAPAGHENQPASRCVTALALRRIEAVYRFGVNVAPKQDADEQQIRSRDELVQRIDEIATRLQLADAARELGASSGHIQSLEEKLLPYETLEELLAKLSTLEGALRKSTSTGEILSVLDETASDVSNSLDIIAKTWPANRSKSARGFAMANMPPGWTGCATCVQREVDQVFEMQHSLKDVRASLVEQKVSEEAAQKSFEEATTKLEALQKEVDQLKQRCDECSALDAEAEMLQAKAKQDTVAQSELAHKLEDARSGREEQERACKDSAAKLAALERDLDERRKRPQQELEGRATPQEIAILKQKSVKGSRDLYAMQVEQTLELEPLPTLLGPVPSASANSKTVESCISGYAGLRRDLLFEWAGTRLTKLAPAADRSKPLSDPLAIQIGRIQQLQIQLSQLRTTIAHVVVSTEAPPPPEKPRETDKNLVRIKLDLHCPRWAAVPPKVDSPLAMTFPELRRLHDVIV